MPLNACTIVSKNYVCFARVLCDSFLEHHPEGRFFVLLVDRNDGHIDPAAESFTLLEAEDLADVVPRLPAFLFKYTLLECNTAIKPFLLEHLVDTYGLDNIVYFDPDIQILHSLEHLESLVQRHSVVLTPHLLHPIDDAAYPGEQAILQSGTYNLGFVAFRVDETSRRLLRWWQERLYDRCVVRIDQGLFVDQKWMDLVPGLYEDVHVLRHPGYNVAYWNLNGREVRASGEGTTNSGATSNGEPLVFFHFSGIQPESLDGVSKHQDRFALVDIGQAADLYREYARRVIDAGYHDCRGWPYAFATFSNGVSIPDAARSLFLQLGEVEQKAWDDPFDTSLEHSFFAWLSSPSSRHGGPLSRFLLHLHAERPELRAAFPAPAGADLPAYRSWLFDVGRHQLKIDEVLLEGLPRETAAELVQPGGLKRKVKNGLKRLYHSRPGKAAKALAKGVLGSERTRALRQQLKPTPPMLGPGTGLPPRVMIERPGVNLIGYLDAETGMGEAARGLARALQAAGVPLSLHTLGLGVVARRDDEAFAGHESDFPFDINLFVVNADQVLPVRDHLGAGVFAGRYNIGLWLWELETFPASLAASFEPLDEIWTPSTFCLDALSAASPIPVRRVPLPVTLREERVAYDRAHFDVPADAFVTLFLFNYLSYAERKNPFAAVEAFREAFGDDPTKLLLLKTSQKDFAPEDHQRLLAAAAESPNIRFIDDYLSRDEVDSLVALADVYISLHRSEGFGLTLAEAMLHGTPVIATPYSGVSDFFDVNTGWPVRHQLVTLEKPAGPYPAGSRWADAEIGHAAELLRFLAEHADEGRHRAGRAKQVVEEELGPDAVGRRMNTLLETIYRRHRAIPVAGIGRG